MAIVLGVLGHILYFVGINKYIILVARAISGIGLGCSTVILAYIARTTTDRQRTSVISLVMASRQIGLMFGPAFNVFLRKFNFLLFNTFLVDRKSSPGLFMALHWLVCLLVICVFYADEKDRAKARSNSSSSSSGSGSNGGTSSVSNLTSAANRKMYKEAFFRVEIFILLAITFFTYFNQTSLETMVIPFTELYFGWNELHNSVLFCIGGIIIILSYALIRVLSQRLSDRWILLIGIASIATGLVIACSCLPFARRPSSVQITNFRAKGPFGAGLMPDQDVTTITTTVSSPVSDKENQENSELVNTSRLITNGIDPRNRTSLNDTSVEYDDRFFPAFVVFVILDVLGLPAIAITSASLFTKLVDNRVQGIGQGIQRGLLGLGTIFGPLCAGPLILKPIVLLAITLGFLLVILIAYAFFFKYLGAREEAMSEVKAKCYHA